MKAVFMLTIGALFFLILTLSGCGKWFQTERNDEFRFYKGKNISLIIKGFNRAPDVLEDWGGYKRYTWRTCRATGEKVIGTRNNNAYYLKPEVVCCDAQFDVNWDNSIVNYNSKDIKYCPISFDFKLD